MGTQMAPEVTVEKSKCKVALYMLTFLLAAIAPAARAQAPEWEGFIGGSYLHANAGSVNVDNENFALTQNGYGWEASIDENKLGGWIGGVADFSGSYANRTVDGAKFHGSVYTYLFGPQFALRRESRISFFGQPLIGVANARENPAGQAVVYNSTKWAFSLGGGADYQLVTHIALRLRGDWIQSHFPEAPVTTKNSQNNFRASIGVVFTAGKTR